MYIFIHVYIYICMLWWICICIYIDRWIFIYTSSILGIPTSEPSQLKFAFTACHVALSALPIYTVSPSLLADESRGGRETKPWVIKGNQNFHKLLHNVLASWNHLWFLSMAYPILLVIYGLYCGLKFEDAWSLHIQPLAARVGKPIGLTGFLLPVDELPSPGNYTHSEAWIQWNLVE